MSYYNPGYLETESDYTNSLRDSHRILFSEDSKDPRKTFTFKPNDCDISQHDSIWWTIRIQNSEEKDKYKDIHIIAYANQFFQDITNAITHRPDSEMRLVCFPSVNVGNYDNNECKVWYASRFARERVSN